MAIRNDFAPGEVLAAADLNDTFGSKVDYPSGGADGEALLKSGTAAAWGAVSQKILQVVRATDSTQRTTTSASFVDASISVTITPQKSDSAILLIWHFYRSTSSSIASFQITDNSNNSISGAQTVFFGENAATGSFDFGPLIAWATPATTSAVTYKGRFAINGADTLQIRNDGATGQFFAIEVAA
jgi:hypothetical protein